MGNNGVQITRPPWRYFSCHGFESEFVSWQRNGVRGQSQEAQISHAVPTGHEYAHGAFFDPWFSISLGVQMDSCSSLRLEGVRIVILNTVHQYSAVVLEKAAALGMMGMGWAWIVTDGTTVGTRPLGSKRPSDPSERPAVPESMVGLIGTTPSSGQGARYHELFPDEEPPPDVSVNRASDFNLKTSACHFIA